MTKLAACASFALLLGALMSTSPVRAAGPGAVPDTDWPLHGLDYSNSRFSPLAQIDSGNVGQLTRAWSLKTGVRGTFQATPVVREGVMYVSTPFNHVLALDAATGAERPAARFADRGVRFCLCDDAEQPDPRAQRRRWRDAVGRIGLAGPGRCLRRGRTRRRAGHGDRRLQFGRTRRLSL